MMRNLAAALAIAIVALTVVGVLGVASADPIAPAGQRNITVNGTAERDVAADASDGAREAAYAAALNAAIDGAQARAQAVAVKLGAALGQVYSLVEQSQPDLSPCGGMVAFDSRSGVAKAPAAARPARPVASHVKKRAHHKAHAASADDSGSVCQQYANVTVTYVIG